MSPVESGAGRLVDSEHHPGHLASLTITALAERVMSKIEAKA